MRPALLFVMVLPVLAACRPSAPDAALFPLTAGHRWTYRVVTRDDDGISQRETLTLRTLGAETAPELGNTPAWRRRSDDGVDYWLRADASGIYRVGSKSDVEDSPRPDQPHRYVLKAPYVPGTQWQSSTTSYLLMRRNEYPREIRHAAAGVTMSYQIEAVDQSVDVPAGHFEGCLRVVGTATLRLYADPVKGWRDIPLVSTEWYCARVGLVRLERSETARYAYVTGGTRTLELESWQ